MIVCHCGVVNDRAVVNAVKEGARTLAGVCRSTGAGQNCGTCIFSIRRLMCDHQESGVPAFTEVDVAAS